MISHDQGSRDCDQARHLERLTRTQELNRFTSWLDNNLGALATWVQQTHSSRPFLHWELLIRNGQLTQSGQASILSQWPDLLQQLSSEFVHLTSCNFEFEARPSSSIYQMDGEFNTTHSPFADQCIKGCLWLRYNGKSIEISAELTPISNSPFNRYFSRDVDDMFGEFSTDSFSAFWTSFITNVVKLLAPQEIRDLPDNNTVQIVLRVRYLSDDKQLKPFELHFHHSPSDPDQTQIKNTILDGKRVS